VLTYPQVMALGLSLAIMLGTTRGLGRHDRDIPEGWEYDLRRYVYVFSVLYVGGDISSWTPPLTFLEPGPDGIEILHHDILPAHSKDQAVLPNGLDRGPDRRRRRRYRPDIAQRLPVSTRLKHLQQSSAVKHQMHRYCHAVLELGSG